MNGWIPILTGMLAFAGVIAGHIVSFNLNSAGKRRDVRRAQLDRFAEFVSEDESCIEAFRTEALWGEGHFREGELEPSDRARAVMALYFRNELGSVFLGFLKARLDYKQALRHGFIQRRRLAATSGKSLTETMLSDKEVEGIQSNFGPYYIALNECLDTASTLLEGTIPERSAFSQWCGGLWAKVRALGRPRGAQEGGKHA